VLLSEVAVCAFSVSLLFSVFIKSSLWVLARDMNGKQNKKQTCEMTTSFKKLLDTIRTLLSLFTLITIYQRNRWGHPPSAQDALAPHHYDRRYLPTFLKLNMPDAFEKKAARGACFSLSGAGASEARPAGEGEPAGGGGRAQDVAAEAAVAAVVAIAAVAAAAAVAAESKAAEAAAAVALFSAADASSPFLPPRLRSMANRMAASMSLAACAVLVVMVMQRRYWVF
jgi:hypothetical protein